MIYGQVKASEAENIEHEESLSAKRVVAMPSNQQKRFDIASTTIYEGTAPRGVSESSTGWMVCKVTLDSLNRPISQQIAYGSWDNRISLEYA